MNKPWIQLLVGVACTCAVPCAAVAACPPEEVRVATTPVIEQNAYRLRQHEAFKARLAEASSGDVLLLGDSLLAQWPERKTAKLFRGATVEQFAIDGERVQSLLWRLDDMDLSGFNPVEVVVMIGTNNLADGVAPCAIAIATELLLDKLHALFPGAALVFISIPPRGQLLDYKVTERREILAQLRATAESRDHLTVLDVSDALTCEFRFGGQLEAWWPWLYRCENYTPDSVHLSDQGYDVLGNAVAMVTHTQRASPPPGSSP